MTNQQAALIAAAMFCAPVQDSLAKNVTSIAEGFLEWLENHD